MRPTMMEKHLSALQPRNDPDPSPLNTLEQRHAQALVALITVIEDQWKGSGDAEETKYDIPRATERPLMMTDDEDGDLLLMDCDTMTIDSLLDISSTSTVKEDQQSCPPSSHSPRVTATKSISILKGRFP